MHNISCIIISNSDDFRFLIPCLKQITPIFKQILIALSYNMWNGEPDDKEKIDDFKTYVQEKYNNIDIVTYNVPDDEVKCMKNHVTPAMYWEGHARWKCANAVKDDNDYVMFIDSDEVIDGKLFNEWLDTNEYKLYDAMKLQNYWYWRDVINRAHNYYEDSSVLIKKEAFNPLHLFSNMGRHGIFECVSGPKKRNMSYKGVPLVHHYSWVRNQKEMLRKVKAWGHRDDRNNWTDLVNEEFSRPFNGTDFLKGLKYDITDNVFDIL